MATAERLALELDVPQRAASAAHELARLKDRRPELFDAGNSPRLLKHHEK